MNVLDATPQEEEARAKDKQLQEELEGLSDAHEKGDDAGGDKKPAGTVEDPDDKDPKDPKDGEDPDDKDPKDGEDPENKEKTKIKPRQKKMILSLKIKKKLIIKRGTSDLLKKLKFSILS